MSSETINSTTAPTPASQETSFTIDGKEYKKSDLNPKTFNSIVVRQDLQPAAKKQPPIINWTKSDKGFEFFIALYRCRLWS